MVTSSNLIIHIYLKKIKHKVIWVCASFKPKKTFTWRDVLENNINHILKSHVIIHAIGINKKCETLALLISSITVDALGHGNNYITKPYNKIKKI